MSALENFEPWPGQEATEWPDINIRRGPKASLGRSLRWRGTSLCNDMCVEALALSPEIAGHPSNATF